VAARVPMMEVRPLEIPALVRQVVIESWMIVLLMALGWMAVYRCMLFYRYSILKTRLQLVFQNHPHLLVMLEMALLEMVIHR
jgi:hypothetical protein